MCVEGAVGTQLSEEDTGVMLGLVSFLLCPANALV